MPRSYVPTKDAAFDDWANNFQTVLTADPTAYQLTTGDAVAVAAAFTSFHSAYLIVLVPNTRTKPAVADKDAKRAALESLCRTYAQLIASNPGVSDANKTAIGLNLPDTTNTPVPVPATNPLITVVGATPGVHTIRFADSATPARRAKPTGALQLILFKCVTAVGGVIPESPASGTMVGIFTKQPFGVAHDAGDNGKIATYFGRWGTRTGQMGPWSSGVSMTIAF